MTRASRFAHRIAVTLALVTALATGCGGLIQYNSGQTTQQARDAAVAETGLALCDPLDLPNIGFEEPVLPGEMLYNSYPFLAGWRSPHGEMLVGRGNLGIDAIPDNAAYGDQHAILKPRRAGVSGASTPRTRRCRSRRSSASSGAAPSSLPSP